MAGGVPRSGGESLLSHGFAVPAPPEGKPRALRTVPAPRIYEGGGPRSGRGSLPHGGESLLSHGFAVTAPPEGKPRALRTVLAPRIYEGGGPRSGRGSPPPQREPSQSRLRRASSPKGRAKGAAPRSPVIPNRFSNRRENPPDERKMERRHKQGRQPAARKCPIFGNAPMNTTAYFRIDSLLWKTSGF